MALNKNKVIAAAQRFAQRGLFDRAISELRTIVEEDPDDVRVWHRIADLQIRKGSVPQAIATYTRIANYYAERGFFLKGVAVYKQILNADPTLVDAHRKLGELYVKLGLGPEAISQFQIVVGTCEREGRHQESLELLKKIVELGPEDESNRIRLAEAYARQSENEEAIEQFRLTLSVLRENRRFDEYVQVAERLLYLYPDELQVVRALSEVYLERNDAKRALARLQTLFRADPSDPGTLALLARAFAAIGQSAKAISVYRELARIHGEAGNAAGQSEAWAQLLALDPDDPEALEATGDLGPRTGEVPLPSGSFSTAGLAPSVGEQASGLLADVELLLKYSLKEHARERLDKVFEIDAYHEGALLKLKELALADERTDEAADALMRLAEGAEKAGDPQKAMSWLGEVIQLRPGDPIAADFMRRVSSGMARQLASSIEPAEASAEYDPPADYDVDLGEIDFDASINDEPAGDGFDLDLGELDASVDDEFAEFMSDGPSKPISTASGAIVLTPPPPADDAFGDLLADEPPPADDAFGDLLADKPPAPAEDDFGGLLADESPAPAAEDDFGDLLADEPPAPAVDDEFGDLLASEPPAPAAEDDFGGLLADEPPAPAADDEFGDLLADEPLAPAAEDDFGGLLADEPSVPAEEDFGGLLADELPAPVLVPDPPASDPLDALDLSGDEPAIDEPAFEPALDAAVPVFDDPPSAAGFVADIPAQDELPDEDEFADLLLDHTGTEAEPDFGVYDSHEGQIDDLEDRLPRVSGAPSEIDIDIDVSMDMPELDFGTPAATEPTPEPDLGLMPPPPPPPPPRKVLGPPPPPPPPAAVVEDDIEEIEELDLDEIIELDDDDLVLEDDSVDGSMDDSVDDSSADGSASLDGSSDELSADSSAGDDVLASEPPGSGAVPDLDLGGVDDDALDSAAGPGDDLDVDLPSGDFDLGADPVGGGLELSDLSDPDALDLGGSADDAFHLGADDDAADLEPSDVGDFDASASGDLEPGTSEDDLDLGASDDDLDLGPSVDESLDASASEDDVDADPAGSADESEQTDLALDVDAPSDDIDEGDLTAGAAADTGLEAADAHLDEPTADAVDDGQETDGAATDAPAAFDPGEATVEPAAFAAEDDPMDGADEDADHGTLDEPADAPDIEAEPAEAAPAPAAAAIPRPRSLPRPPGFGAASLKLGTGLPSAPKPLSASSLSLDTRSMPSPPKPAAPMAPAAHAAPAAPAAPVAPAAPSAPAVQAAPVAQSAPAAPAEPEAVDEQALLPPPEEAGEMGDGDKTVAVNVSDMAELFEQAGLEPSLSDQTEAGGLSHDGPASLGAVPTEASLDEELAEIDFLIESGLIDDARELVRELRTQHPDHSGLQARADSLESPFGEGEDDFLSGFTDDFDLDFGEVKGAELSDLGDDEADTHFDLGLAFKEMGQYGKAIAELELAARRADKRAEALRIIALCHSEQGNAEQAASTLQDALTTADLPLNARAGLQYDLANVYEQLGQTDEARAQLEGIVAAGMDDFLDVKTRLATLGS